MKNRSGEYVAHFDQALAESLDILKEGRPFILFTFDEKEGVNTACIACDGSHVDEAMTYLLSILFHSMLRSSHFLLTDYPSDEDDGA